jgi:hypothetical protein
MKIKYFYFVFVLSISGFIAFSAFVPPDDGIESNGNDKLIKFSHKLHSDVADCKDCHTKVPSSTTLNDRLLPDHDACSQCHSVDDENNCKTCHFDEKFEALNQPKFNMIFNHSFHINDQKLECVFCHKGLGNVEYGFQSPNVFPSMETCYSCHNSEKGVASSQCEACHISTVDLIPASHKTSDFKMTHKFVAERNDADCSMCHDNTSCGGCHVGTNMLTEKNLANDFYAPYSPNNYTDGTKQQKITRVHDLNYVYTHGMDLKGKESECQTCHEIETFCAECHNTPGGDYAIPGFIPSSHKTKDFMIIGVGTGGGQHAVDARRDIESCASCHDTQGADPTCILCHIDTDGIKGTNPKTHPAGFMRDEHGDWHSDNNSICFNCHVSTYSAGIGFCGYCHGAKAN